MDKSSQQGMKRPSQNEKNEGEEHVEGDEVMSEAEGEVLESGRGVSEGDEKEGDEEKGGE
jgi:hypothetical protein